jgi:hypothetical protein
MANRRAHTTVETDMSSDTAAKAGRNTWVDIVVATLKANQVQIVAYVPDKVMAPLIERLHGDAYFATLANVLASLVVAYQVPVLMLISERGTLGDHQLGQAIVCRTMRPVLETLGIEHHAITRLDETQFIVDRTIKQAIATQAPAALILSPLLTHNPAYQ